MEGRTYRVFVSHSWEPKRRQTVQDLLSLLTTRGVLTLQNTAITANNPIDSRDEYYIRRKIRERIRASDILLFVAKPSIAASKWMQFEIQTASNEGKPILAVKPLGARRLPSIVTELNISLCGWRALSIERKIMALCKREVRNPTPVDKTSNQKVWRGPLNRQTPERKSIWGPIRTYFDAHDPEMRRSK